MSKFYNFQNTLSIIAVVIVLVFSYCSRIGMLSLLSVNNYVSIFALASTILILPDFLSYYFPCKNRWFQNSEFFTILLIVLLGVSGLLIKSNMFFLNFTFIILGLILSIWNIVKYIRNISIRKILTLVAGIFFMGFIILLFYSQGYHSPLLPEKIIIGKAHIDTLFHSSISNLFSTTGWSTTGLDGTPFFHYHWGSHALFAGLKNWIGIDSLMFFNIAYPAIFIPLFFKSFFSFLNRLNIHKGLESFNLLFAIAMLTLLYSAKIYGFNGAHPMVSESSCVSLIFTFLYGSILLSYASKPCFQNMFFIYSLMVLLTISIFKISTGFVLVLGIAYLSLRNSFKIKNILWVIVGWTIIAALVYLFIYPEARTVVQATIAMRVYNLWAFSNGFITRLLGAFIAVIIVLKNKQLLNWRGLMPIIKSKEYIELEILFVINVVGFLGAVAVTSNHADVFYFLAPQFFIAIVFLIFYAQNSFDRFISTKKVKSIFLILVIIFSIVSRPKFIHAGYEIANIKQELANLTEGQHILKDYIVELFNLEKKKNKKAKIVYIPHSEEWYYNSQQGNEVCSALITPAISGIALIGGISDSTFTSGSNYYSVYYYKKEGRLPIRSIYDAKKEAAKKGYKELIQFQDVDMKLGKQVFKLVQ